MSVRIGIDVGGTNTDAVILDEELRCIAKVKTATTDDVEEGIVTALSRVIRDGGVDPSRVQYAMLGTTHCTNAVVERKRLNRVGVIRIGLPATAAIQPMTGWPSDLKAALGEHGYLVPGGHEFDGRMIAPLGETEIRAALRRMEGQVDAVAITSVFAPVSDCHEREAEAIVRAEWGDSVPVSLSHEVGSIGLVERENATILNAALMRTAEQVVRGFQQALEREGIRAPLFLGQNDGTLMSADYARQYPILTIACGPTNSIRGAAHLSGYSEGLVVDVGGTTTDVGVLVKGFPRESAVAVEIGGVRTNFRMPDLLSVGLGGGTVVRGGAGAVTLGPDSVGYRLHQKARVFGGDTWTATDVAVAAGRIDWNGPQLKMPQKSAAEARWCEEAYQRMVTTVEEAIDRMKTSAAPVPAILVGGGSVLLPDRLEGVSEVIRHGDYDVANAIGAAIGQVSGQVERVYSLSELSRSEAMEHAKKTAVGDAVKAGADPATVTIVDVEDVPLAYLPGNAVRIRVKAAGTLQQG
ncbi:hydantoinase/oxoprolinase family protein [Desmospora profundinema]|uniref:N-methylhydantoinase A/oxoprolinase/acetone carboxylase beta subunit n=1 Tax=Desmospora profundinema TaxID=1571184 RepID=A0ABU1IRC2_9BACL|nr:hydantoinase/oxoprolinase family protein [Desmospora profundinema]MDR6226704.1 N-methylhydantoinase A/oxoprolinase/acetone carboxylase beta subunit [Desmospora profundinema]